jgi:hypothetical protein
VRDGISIARQGTPAVALVTEMFWPQGDFVAAAAGMPTIPRIQLPHPVAGSGQDALALEAERIADQILAIIRGDAEAAIEVAS